jgi:hypothetical protein
MINYHNLLTTLDMLFWLNLIYKIIIFFRWVSSFEIRQNIFSFNIFSKSDLKLCGNNVSLEKKYFDPSGFEPVIYCKLECRSTNWAIGSSDSEGIQIRFKLESKYIISDLLIFHRIKFELKWYFWWILWENFFSLNPCLMSNIPTHIYMFHVYDIFCNFL